MSCLKDPLVFLIPSRLDLVVKYIYAKSYLENNLTDEIKNLYIKHIEKRTGGVEPTDIYGTPTYKYNVKDYENSFISLIESLKLNGFDSSYPIPFHNNGIIGNGAHRIGASIALGQNVYAYEVDGVGYTWDFSWFREHHFTEDELNIILYHWCLLKTSQKNLNYIILWAPTQNFLKDSLEIIKENTNFVGYFDYFFQDNNHLEKFLLNLYAFSSKDTLLEAIHRKILLLKEYKLVCKIVIINDINPFEQAKKTKENLRNYLSDNIRKELFITAHCLDNADEVEFFNEVFFNKVILENTNNTQMIEWFLELNEDLEKNNIRKNDICIVGSSVMDIYNIRPSTDIDFTVTSNLRTKYGEGVTKLSSNVDIVTLGYHRTDFKTIVNDDELINDPKNHFLCRGYKFANLSIIRDRKEYSRREKDLIDVELIDDYYCKKKYGNLYFLVKLKTKIFFLIRKFNFYKKLKQFIKIKISNFVTRIATEVSRDVANQVSQEVSRDVANQVSQEVSRDVANQVSSEILNKRLESFQSDIEANKQLSLLIRATCRLPKTTHNLS